MRNHFSIVLAIAAMLTLTACGGGGGGAGVVSSSIANQAGADIAVDSLDAAKDAASSTPNFGSVTKSSNTNNSGVTTDQASVAFSNKQVKVTITREDGSVPLILDTERNMAYREGPYVAPLSEYKVPIGEGYFYKAEGVKKVTTNKRVLTSSLYTHWKNDDPTDYLAGGYWIYGNGADIALSGFDHVEIGAFADGPEISSPPNSLPNSGSATYKGRSVGIFNFDSSGGDEVGVAEYWANIALTANFSAQTISGCVGCDGGIDYYGLVTNITTGKWYRDSGNALVKIQTGQTRFNNDGEFKGKSVFVEYVDPYGELTVTDQKGSWGGRFSNIPDAKGRPRLAAGTIGTSWTLTGDVGNVKYNDKYRFVGSWFATAR